MIHLLGLNISSWNYVLIIVETMLFVIAAFIALSLISSTVKLGISPMPSSAKANSAMLTLVDESGTGPVIDLGSGWGNFAIAMAKHSPQRQVIGYELSLLPWLISVSLKKLLKLKNLSFYRQSFYKAHLPKGSVLVCYLFPQAMHEIESNLLLNQPNVDFLISNNFALPSWQPCKTIQISDFYKSPIYQYKINKLSE